MTTTDDRTTTGTDSSTQDREAAQQSSQDVAAQEVAAQEVGDRMLQVLDDGAVVVLTALGYHLGLFDRLAALPPATSQQVADAAGLDERYVREWLGGVTTAGLVTYDPASRRYALSPDHAPFVTGTGVDNLARTMSFVVVIAQAVPKLVEKFRTGGGLGYDDYPGFHELQAAESAAVNDASLVDSIVPLTGLTDALRAGIDVADIGCGEGHAINLLAREFPASRFTGFDLSEEALAAARVEAAAWGLANAAFVACDVASAPAEQAYDLVTAFDAVHDQAHPATVLENVRRSLRPGGTFLMVDVRASSRLEDNLDLPWASFLYAASVTHCMSVSLGQGGDGLGTVWGVQLAEQMLGEAGFHQVRVVDLDDDPFNAYFVARA